VAKKLRVIELLLDRGADLEWRNGDGRTPLHVACRKLPAKLCFRNGWGEDELRVARLLLKRGADPGDDRDANETLEAIQKKVTDEYFASKQ
jgi:ankyrin repeat protein